MRHLRALRGLFCIRFHHEQFLKVFVRTSLQVLLAPVQKASRRSKFHHHKCKGHVLIDASIEALTLCQSIGYKAKGTATSFLGWRGLEGLGHEERCDGQSVSSYNTQGFPTHANA